MADPLSVAAGIVGLLTAAAQTSLILKELISKARDAPQSCRRVRNDVEDIRNVLGQLQMYLNGGKQAMRSRTALIMIDQVAATLASCITTFDKLKLFVEGIRSESHMGILDRARWVYKTDELENFQTRLEAHKSSLTLMMIILTCQKQDDAEDKVDALCEKVDQIYKMNVIVAQRMMAWDMSQVGVLVPDTLAAPTGPNDTTRTSSDVAADQQGSGTTGAVPEQVQRDSRGFAFEELLMNSRAYRSAAHNNSEAFSVMTAAGRTATWSMLSGLSLSEMSNIAILAIPVYAQDLNDKEAYDFEVPATDINDNFGRHENTGLEDASSESSKERRSLRNFFKRTPASSKQTEAAASPAPVFGVPLEQSIRYANVAISLTNEQGESFIYGYVPIVIAKCGVFLKQTATEAEDIFAHNGHAARVAALRQQFDTLHKHGEGLQWTGYTVHDAATVLLRFLKSLPEPLVPYVHYEGFVAHFRSLRLSGEEFLQEDARKEVAKDLQRRVLDLPPTNRQALLYVLDLLGVFASKSDINKMTAARLVSSFQPSLLSKRPAEMDTEEHIYAADAASFLLDNETDFLMGTL